MRGHVHTQAAAPVRLNSHHCTPPLCARDGLRTAARSRDPKDYWGGCV